MPEVKKVRRPDKRIYRHPRYEVNQDGEKFQTDFPDSLCNEYPSNIPNKISSNNRGQSSYRGHSGSMNSRDKGYNRTEVERQRNPRPLPSSVVQFSRDGKSDTDPSNSTANVSKHVSDVHNNFTKNEASMMMNSSKKVEVSAGKHGGLIHLPKNIDIYQSAEEPRAGPSRQVKRGPQGPSKPVVVVRPSFPQSTYRPRDSEPADSFHGNIQSDCLKTDRDNRGQSFPTPPNFDMGMANNPWTDAAKAAYQYVMQGLANLDTEHNRLAMTSNFPTSRNQKGEAHGTSVTNLPTSVQPPNEKIATTVQQIVQLDNTLNALLIPPGLCARAMPCIQPTPPHPKKDKEWTEPQVLLLRWWASVQGLRIRLFTLFESVILADLDFCNAAHVEQGMWKSVFYTILELLRSWVGNPEATNLVTYNRVDQEEKYTDERSEISYVLQHICLEDVICAGEARLCGLLDRIQALHGVQLAPILANGRPPPETRSRTRRLVYLSAQKLMLFLGDLARYKEVLTGERNFGKARNWYQKAQLLIPKNGRSYNQLAVLAVYTSRHLDAMYYYMRTLAASNPFPTASQSLAALFNEIEPKAQSLHRQLQKPKNNLANSQSNPFSPNTSRYQRVEIWVHPMDGQTMVLQGTRRLVFLPTPHSAVGQRSVPSRAELDAPAADNVDEDEEDAEAELEEYANMSLIELSKQFGLTFIHAHGKLYTKIGMETFPEVASLSLQALLGLLSQKPCPLTGERLLQLCIVNMYNVDRAMSLTTHANSLTSPTKANADSDPQGMRPISRLAGSETLRSVHHDHAARFALDTFSLLCRRTSQLLQEPAPVDAPPWWLPSDARILLASIRLWLEWMILHPEHWLPPPNHRDPTLRPCLNDWQLVAELCTQAANWLNRNAVRPHYDEVTPTTSLVIQRKEGHTVDEDADEAHVLALDSTDETAFLFEEAFCAGFKPMLDLVPKMYRCTGNWPTETVADFVRVDKVVLFGDFLCGIDSPVLTYDVDRAVYESAVERESSERKQDRPANRRQTMDIIDQKSQADFAAEEQSRVSGSSHIVESEATGDIAALQRQRSLLKQQLEEENRLATWRHNAIRQAASGGRRAVELDVRPIYLLPDTNCYIDWLEGIATLSQRSSNYTVLVPIVVVNELDTLARLGSSSAPAPWKCGFSIEDELEENTVTRAGLIQERARAAIAYLEHEFAHRNSRLRALTARGSFMETIAYRNEINGGRAPGQINDDVILACCNHFCKDDSERFRQTRVPETKFPCEENNQPMRLHREIVLLTSDRNLRLKALNINVPARPLRTFVNWSRLPVVANLPNTASEPVLPTEGRKAMEFPKPQPRGQWKQPLRH